VRTLLFLDTETGGLDPTSDELIEVAWATLADAQPSTLVLPHHPHRVGEKAAEVNNYYSRQLADPECWATNAEIQKFYTMLHGVTIVGANPSFDAAFLAKHFATNPFDPPWHYRMLDIESMAYGVLALNEVEGMSGIRRALVDQGFPIPIPDHTAAGDVTATVAIYHALRFLSDRNRAAEAIARASPCSPGLGRVSATSITRDIDAYTPSTVVHRIRHDRCPTCRTKTDQSVEDCYFDLDRRAALSYRCAKYDTVIDLDSVATAEAHARAGTRDGVGSDSGL
jgi:hypothetical protein